MSMPNHAVIAAITELVYRPELQSNHKDIITSDLLRGISSLAGSIQRRNPGYIRVDNVEDKSEGLNISNDTLTLVNDWGVKVNRLRQNYINNPVSIKNIQGRYYIANSESEDNTNKPCVILDSNFNLEGTIGSIGPGSGQYTTASDFAFSSQKNKYYVVAPEEHKVLTYRHDTKAYVDSIGSGTAGADGDDLTSPVAIDFGRLGIYVLCSGGTCAGASGTGFLARYSFDQEFRDIPLYPGKHGGNGECYRGEIKNPIDIHIQSVGGEDLVYILNGTGEVGVFNSDKNWQVQDVINVPNEYSGVSMGYKKIYADFDNLYLTAANLGKVIVIDLKTKKLVGAFGMLTDESSNNSDETLGYFNGLSGITVVGGNVVVTESINNRIQVFGKSLLKDNDFSIVYQNTHLPNSRDILDIVYSFKGVTVGDIKIVTLDNLNEYSIENAQSRRLEQFKIKVKIPAYKFSRKNSAFEVAPIYVLIQEYKP